LFHHLKKFPILFDLSFSNLSKGQQNIAFIDVPGHEKLVKNMIAGAFGFDYVMLVVSASEGIKPQTIEHIEIINLLGLKEIIVVITKKDLVTLDDNKEYVVADILEYNNKKYICMGETENPKNVIFSSYEESSFLFANFKFRCYLINHNNLSGINKSIKKYIIKKIDTKKIIDNKIIINTYSLFVNLIIFDLKN
jgi:translation elongation factor EF-G